MVKQLAIAGADRGKPWPRLLLAHVVVVSALTACGSVPSKNAGKQPAPDVAQIDPASKDAPTAPGNASPANEPPVSEPQTQAPEPPTLSEPPPGPPQAQFEPLDGDNVLENTRQTVRSTTDWLARGVDSWFGDQPFDEGGEVRDGRLSVGLFKRKDESLDARVRFNVRLRLPNAERRAYLFVGRDNEREVVSDTPGALTRQERLQTEARDDRSFF